jgi:hypothetical protein
LTEKVDVLGKTPLAGKKDGERGQSTPSGGWAW